MAYHSVSRRQFIRSTAFTGIAFNLGLHANPRGGTSSIAKVNPADNLSTELIAWISIDQQGHITIANHRSEMGQGTHQSIAQIIAEELEVTMDQITVKFAAANPAKYGPQPSEGSFSIRGWYKQLLQTGASARMMLITAAASRWKVDTSSCFASEASVVHRPSGRKLGYGQLVATAATLPVPSSVMLKPRSEYTIIGKPLRRKDIPGKVNGSVIFGLDFKLPGMLYAMVERNPRFIGKVKSFDASQALAIPGVRRVMKVQRPVFNNMCEGVAVVADNIWTAMQARKLLRITWDDNGFDYQSSEGIHQQMILNIDALQDVKEFDTFLNRSVHQLQAIYETPYQAHSCMEPLNCTVHVQSDRIDVWGPVQEANWIQSDLSQRLNVPIENVHVNMTFLGGGFGRKGFTDYPAEAAMISKEMNAPVQTVWSREDDTSIGPFRPGAIYSCRGGLDAAGKIHALQIKTSTQWIGQAWSLTPSPPPDPPTHNKGHIEGIAPPYLKQIPHYSFGSAGIRSPIPLLWWRSVDASTNAFAIESFIDELGHHSGMDALEFRRLHLEDDRYRALINRLDLISGWSKRSEKGWGMAVTECFKGICAHVVKAAYDDAGKIRIKSVTALMDCGWYVNPDIIKAQVEGAIVMALGAAIKHEIHFEDGKTVEKNFDSYRMPRIMDVPPIEVHIMDNHEDACGVGEPGLPPFAPALSNAIFDLTGKRIRKLPFSLDEI